MEGEKDQLLLQLIQMLVIRDICWPSINIHSNAFQRRIPLFGSISEPLARSEGWVGGKGMKKIMIVKDKKKVNEKV